MKSQNIKELKNRLHSLDYNDISNVLVVPASQEINKKENELVVIEKINVIFFQNSNLLNLEKIIFKDMDDSLNNSFLQLTKTDANIVHIKNCSLTSLIIHDSNINTLIIENSVINSLDINGCNFKDIKNEYKFPLPFTMLDYAVEDEDEFKINNISIIKTEVENNVNFNHLEADKFDLIKFNCSSLILSDCLIKSNLTIKDSTLNNLSIESLRNKIVTFDSEKSTKKIFNNYLEISKTFIINDYYFNDVNLGRLELSECRVMCSMIWNNINLKTIKLLNTTLEKNFKFFNLNISNLSKLDDETCRVFKSFALKNNDQSGFLKFNMLEQNKLFENKKFDDSDYWILLCKKYFSNHGTSWVQAIIMTLVLSFLFYVPIFIFLKNNFAFCQFFSSEFLNGFIRFLNITDYFNPIVFDKRVYIDNPIALILMFLGKIVLGIGIYETITSFRKYHK